MGQAESRKNILPITITNLSSLFLFSLANCSASMDSLYNIMFQVGYGEADVGIGFIGVTFGRYWLSRISWPNEIERMFADFGREVNLGR